MNVNTPEQRAEKLAELLKISQDADAAAATLRAQSKQADADAYRAHQTLKGYEQFNAGCAQLEKFKGQAQAAINQAAALSGIASDVLEIRYKAPARIYFSACDCWIEVQSCDYAKRPRRYTMNKAGRFNIKLIAAAFKEFADDYRAYAARMAKLGYPVIENNCN